MNPGLAASYSWCRGVARSRARNFYYSFVLLSPGQRDAMCAVYAFMRRCDDMSDEPRASASVESRRSEIEAWRGELSQVLDGGRPPHPLWPALEDAVRRFQIPPRYLYEMIDGVASDLDRQSFASFEELYRYCYQVASVVGLTIVHIFGFRSPDALPLAEKCGVAFQLTNILRDVREDAEAGRVYLPSEDLLRFNVAADSFRPGPRSDAFVALMRFEAARARSYYNESKPLVGLVERRSRPCLRALIGIYSRLLDRIEQSGYDVLNRRIRLPLWEKALIVLRSAIAL